MIKTFNSQRKWPGFALACTFYGYINTHTHLLYHRGCYYCCLLPLEWKFEWTCLNGHHLVAKFSLQMAVWIHGIFTGFTIPVLLTIHKKAWKTDTIRCVILLTLCRPHSLIRKSLRSNFPVVYYYINLLGNRICETSKWNWRSPCEMTTTHRAWQITLNKKKRCGLRRKKSHLRINI